MKRKGSGLGSLSSQFFAYIQLKNKEIVRTGDIAPVLGLTAVQERTLLSRLAESGWIVRLKRGVYLSPPRLPAGGRYGPGAALILQKLMAEEKAVYQICGPSAFQFHGLTDQIANVTHVYNDRLSGSRTIGGLQFHFIKVAAHRLGSTQTVRTSKETQIVYSSKARTLMDSVYDWSRFNSLPLGYNWIVKSIQADRKQTSILVGAVIQYGNQATLRRTGYLLDSLGISNRTLNRLQRELTASTALIPWIPTRSTKGSINRHWGIIVNG